ncbi:MAG TPA: hypothetical protein VKA67_10345, partial [Verrucomicrobiae bacterium]|nr:hypothetical protein [Verrucomicrobiae bacterium]
MGLEISYGKDSMKKLSCRMLTVSLIAGCLGVGLSACVQQNSEPLVNGKPLSFWLRQYNSTSVSGGEPEKTALNEQAVSAVRSIGTNAIPTLLKLIRTTNSHQQSLRNHYPQPVHLSEANIEGINGFFILGEAASNAVPALVEIFEDQKSPTSQASAAWALDGIGPGATAAIPALLRAATNSESSTHPLAFLVLAEIPASYDEVIPIAAHALSDTNFLVRINAMDVLGSRGSNAKAAVPALV